MTGRLSDIPEARGALEELRSSLVVAFLVRQGWETVARGEERSYVVLEDPDEERIQVKVPLDRHFSDYLQALELAVERMASSFDVSPREILLRLRQDQNDVLLVSADIETSQSLKAEDGLRLLNASWRALTACAWAEDTGLRRSLYSGPRSGRLSGFLNSIRLAHSRPGSFAFPLLSPIPEPARNEDVLDFVVESFERRALRRTVSAVAAAVGAAVEFRDSGRFKFRDLIPDGVSANLCRALADLPDEFPVKVQASWSPVVPEDPRSAAVQPGLGEVFTEAADRLGPETLEGRVTIVGHVRLLHREHGEQAGEIGVRSILRDSPGIYRVQLNPMSYALAVEAHAADRTVLVEGEVDRYGPGRQLLDPDFKVLGVSLPEYFDDSSASDA